VKVQYDLTGLGVTERQLELLRPYLLGERPREDGEWDMYCPLHEDRSRSAQLNIERGVWHCFAGCDGGSVAALVRKRSEWVPPGRASGNGHSVRRSSSGTLPQEEITSAKVEGWAAALLDNEPILDDLVTTRGLWTKTIADAKIGWDSSKKAYTIPIADAEGKYVNVRRYQPRPRAGRRKMWGVEGMNQPRLYPIEALKEDGPIIICEGEWDARITRQHGFSSITRTASASTWKDEWSKLFKGRVVYVCHDMDKEGQKANLKVARSVATYAEAVYIVRLPYPIAEKGGKDLTDYFMDHEGDPDEFRRLLEEARQFDASEPDDPEDVGPEDVSVLDTFDAQRVGRPVRATVTIKAKKDPGYSIPRRVLYTCTQDAGDKCESCPLFRAEGEAEKIIPGGDPAVLELIDATRPQVTNALRRFGRIKECDRLSIEVKEFQSVEVLFARPSVDHMNGANAEDYKNLRLISVGRHDTMPNNTVQVVGALYPEPRSQLNTFLAWDVARMETSLDRFELDRETIQALERFRPSPGQRPLKKIREITDDLADHVTRIYGRPELHALIDLVYHSILSFDFAGKRVHRGWLDALVVGDTRTGKSEAAIRLARHYRAGEVVSCESATLAGIVGGLQQFGVAKEWAITWGSIPLNDRRLVVLDEASGLDSEKIGEMSSVRSSGIAELTKIQQERTYARTRLLWLGNPRNAQMQDYTYGVQAIRPLIGNAEDIARFDLAMSVAAGEVGAETINRLSPSGTTRYPSAACSALVRWVWSRTPDQVTWAPGAEAAVLREAKLLGQRYIEDPPLVQVANVREKVARIAAAIAARTFSADETGERLVIDRRHVKDAVAFIDLIYGMTGFGYLERSKELIADAAEAREKAKEIKVFLYNKPWLAKFLRSAGKFRRQDLEEIGNTDREEANAIINKLWEARMVVKDKGDVRLTPTLHNILREVNVR
jgi:hypothetical protein